MPASRSYSCARSLFFSIVLAFSLLAGLTAAPATAQPLLKSAVQTDPGSTKLTGDAFGYRLTYACNNTGGDCLNAIVVDLLPLEVEFLSTVPAAPSGDVAAINVTPNFMGSGRTQVEFVMVSPLTAGNSGDLLINVRFPNGSTPNGSVATNTADGTNLETTPGTFTTPPVDVTAVASPQFNLSKVALGDTDLDLPIDYRLRISVPSSPGSLNLSGITVTDTLEAGVIFNGATPAADCEPGCIGTAPGTLIWTGPFSVSAGSNLDFTVTVTYPTPTFTDGQMVTNSFTADGTPVGEPARNLGIGTVTHPVTTFVADPNPALSKVIGPGPNPPTLFQDFSYQLIPQNTGNVPLDSFVLIDTLPIQISATSVTSGAYSNYTGMVTVSYQTNLAAFAALGTSAATSNTSNTSYPIPALGAGEYVTHLRWEYSGQVPPNMAPSSSSNRPRINAQVIDPDNLGATVSFGATITNCSDVTAIHDPSGANTAVNAMSCRDFTLSGPFTQHAPNKVNISAFGGPYAVNDTVSFELRANNSVNASDPLPIENMVVVDLLPEDLIYTPGSQAYNANGTGLPAPTFEEIPNYMGTGRTLLRWTWPPASGDLAPGQEVRITIDTTVRFGAEFGPLSNQMGMTQNDPGLAQRCSSSMTDDLDMDGDTDFTDILCVNSVAVDIAPIAQLISGKLTRGLCDADFTSSSLGTLPGGKILYQLSVTNAGTVPMENFVIIDILPFVGDTGVLDLSPRSSLWDPALAAPITPPPGTVIYYSTSGNPCRGEVGGPTTGCDPPNWTTVAPMPLSTIRSFKIEFGSRVVGPADQLIFEFPMVAPNDAPLGGLTTFNSFAYLGGRSDGLGNLSAEPNKVGMTIGSCAASSLGDFVWVDSDGDGTQNDGLTGLNDVQVQLFNPGADGIPRTLDDVLLSTTQTADDSSGDPGWYQFPGLAAGDYYVQFFPPPTHTLTLQGAGGDPTLDSDADPATACSPVVTLAVDEINPDIDAGLIANPVAELGNYVWFDRNGNGLQDESPFDGINGVAVKLFVDDGDGNPEPGGDDGMPVATTATADDTYGAPGYYRFDDLIPGLPYFVQFMLPASATGFTAQDAGGDDTIDSDADVATGASQVVTLTAGEFNPTIDAGVILPSGDLVLGNQVWCDGDPVALATDNDGLYQPELGEFGVDGVSLSLYLDANADGQPTVDEYVGSTATATISGFAGRYQFEQLSAGDYIVVVELDNFAGGGPLEGKVSSTGNDPAPDPDDDVNSDDNGSNLGALVTSQPVTLVDNNEPTTDDGDPDTNLTIDFGFAATTAPAFDYGDAPDVAAGNGPADYRTAALDIGPLHLQEVAGSPYLGACVDADDGTNQDAGASRDDNGSYGVITGTCATAGDDEDGVVFLNQAVPGLALQIEVTASTGTNDCVLDAWIDWDQSGTFGDSAGEQIATSQTMGSGSTATLTPTVPAAAIPGLTYGRFRCSSAGGLTPNDAALDGEVEDYLIGIEGTDFGDAPDSFGTTTGSGGASHLVDPIDPLFLGACIDTEADGQPSAAADGDDGSVGTTTIGPCADDEEGVIFDTMVIACQMAQVTVTSNQAAMLDGWINFNGNTAFDATDQIFTAQPLAAGANTLTFAVPCDAAAGTQVARFRLSSVGGLGATGGPALDGEVEDYAVLVKGNDWGDAPATYPTLMADGGALHGVDPTNPFHLGACVDTEADGQPSALADGDDNGAGSGTVGTCATVNDDEDGVAFTTMVIACQNASMTITANIAGTLDGWIDFNRDGDWADAGERIFAGNALAAGSNSRTIAVPCNAVAGTSFARFRLSSSGIATPGGPVMDGEVEDYAVLLKGSDYGDAPDSYGTLVGSGGPLHGVDTTSSLFLGVCADTELNGQVSATANGDDLAAGANVAGACAGGDDEDGVIFATMLIACQNADISVVAGAAGVLDGWIDFDRDGSFAVAERVFAGQAVAAGLNALTVAVPCSASAGQSFSRFRLSSTGVAGPGGAAMDGEIEDHTVLLKGTDFGDAPDSYQTTFASGGPNHGVDAALGLFFGTCVDTEADASTPLDASGDDATVGATTVGTCAANDDEDGIVFDTPLVACRAARITVTASVAGLMDAWIDFDGDGSFATAGDQVFASQALGAGTTTLTFAVPCTASEGNTFARFRLSTAGGLGHAGPAMDGEVEDYLLLAEGSDFGDAPDSYLTTFASGGPSHGVDPAATLFLGSCVDTEDDAGAPLDATGDDSSAGDQTVGTCAAANDDEDGVAFTTMLFTCQQASLTVTAGAAGRLDGWIDFDGDGTFNGLTDQVFASQALVAGANVLTLDVPCAASVGQTFARFRFSSVGGLAPAGPTLDGEVEDYAVEVKAVDFGDAPDSYGTTFAAGGPHHGLLPGFQLGAMIDGESDGQPNVTASGDGADEDGVTFAGGMAMASACATTDLTVALTNTAGVTTPLLDAWVDYDGDGAFTDPRDRIATSLPLTGAATTVTFTVPCDAPSVDSYARFRLTSTGVATPGGPAMDGEVEDYTFTLKGLDFGDAAVGYPTLLADDGARHSVLPTNNPTLGALTDTEPDGQPSPAHNGDDVNGTPDDEDGVSFTSVLVPGTIGTVNVTTGATGGAVSVWVDFNQNGSWADAGEQVATDVAFAAATTTVLSFPVPVGSPQGSACARVRLSSQTGLLPTGAAPDGEVEDHLAAVGVEDPIVGLAKQLVDVVNEGGGFFLVTFDLNVQNLGNVALSDVNMTVDLASVFSIAQSFEVSGVMSLDLAVNGSFDGDTDTSLLDPGNTLGVGEMGLVTLEVRIEPGTESGPYVCTSTAVGTSPGAVIVSDTSQDGGDPDPDGNGDPGNNSDPTLLEFPLSPAEIPTLGTFGFLLLMLLLAGAAVRSLRRRHTA